MPWFKVDDGFADHPKLELLEGDPLRYAFALAVWVLMGPDCARRLTGGRASPTRVKRVCLALGDHAIEGADALVEAGLWERIDGDYAFKNWSDYQPSKAEVEAKIAKKTARQQRWRANQREQKEQAVDAAVDASTSVSRDAPVERAPSHPIPSHPELRSWEGEAVTAEALRAQALAREQTHAREEHSEWTPERQSIAFQAAYLSARQTSPSMGGRQVGDFHRRVIETAKARDKSPESLFKEVLDRWLQRPLNEREKSAPYACFANAFGELVDRQSNGMTPELAKMREQVLENIRIVRGGA